MICFSGPDFKIKQFDGNKWNELFLSKVGPSMSHNYAWWSFLGVGVEIHVGRE